MSEGQAERPTLYTIGHSNHEVSVFLGLLAQHGITAVADVRSSPYSQYNPQYNREILELSLRQQHVQYVFLGRELGARREEPECYEGTKARYDLIPRSPLFRQGLERLRRGMARYRIALMCAEKDPLGCHRAILLCRQLRHEMTIRHILEDGRLEPHDEAERRLLDLAGLPERDLFHTTAELVEQAYDIQGEKIAYVESQPEPENP